MAKVCKGTRERVYKRDGFRCCYCDRSVTIRHDYADDMATVDHVVSKRRGGSNRFGNLVTACWPCNHAKGDEDALHFLARRFARAA